MSEQVGVDWLAANGYKAVGYWSPDSKKLIRLADEMQHPVRLPGIRAVYAFVADGKVSYIGKATHLRRRLRAYNRSLSDKTERPFEQFIKVSGRYGITLR